MPGGLPYDLLLSGGEVLDPGQHVKGRRDIAIAHGTIAAIAERIDPSSACQILDLRGHLVTPGLIDLHGHYYHGGARAVDPQISCLPHGVATGIDAGSAGHLSFPGFRDYVVPAHRQRVRLPGFLHVGAPGVAMNPVTGSQRSSPWA